MFCVPTVIQLRGQAPYFADGAIIKLPSELCTKYIIEKYKSITTLGWGVSEFGYSFYSFEASEELRIVFVGLMLTDGPKVAKKFNGYNATLSRSAIEVLANQITCFFRKHGDTSQDALNSFIHDIRSLSRDIYHAAVEGEDMIERGLSKEATARLGNIQALQSLLKMRIDAFDFIDGDIDSSSRELTPIYRAIDKVCRIFKPRAYDRNVDIFLSGSSEMKALVPSHFSIAPYVIIENAIKYSPDMGIVNVFVYDHLEKVVVTFESFGPKVETQEREKIFERGYRSKDAIGKGINGSGLGLYLVKKILSGSGVTINFEQSTLDENPPGFFKTIFRLDIPAHKCT